MTGALKVCPPSVERTSSTWLRLSVPVTALLKLAKATYSVPSGPVNGSEYWFSLQFPCGVGTPKVLLHRELVPLTTTGVLKVCP